MSHHDHLISTQLLNITSQFFPLLSTNTSTYLIVYKKMHILSQQIKLQTNVQTRKSFMARHGDHKDFCPFPYFAFFTFASCFASAYQKYKAIDRVGEGT